MAPPTATAASSVIELKDGAVFSLRPRRRRRRRQTKERHANADANANALLLPLTLTKNNPLRNTNSALRDQLERTGAWSKLQARVRAEVYGGIGRPPAPARAAAADDAADDADDEADDAERDGETLLINELIREYLLFSGLRDTLSVFLPESGSSPVRPFGRGHLEERTGAGGAGAGGGGGRGGQAGAGAGAARAARLPLLYSMVAQARRAAAVAGELQ